jgi:hypothetical protein
MKKTPVQRVREEFGSKEQLASKLIGVLDRREDEDQEEFERRIKTASNRQLLRLWKAEEDVKAQFGSKDGLVDAIVSLKFVGKDNADYRAKVTRYAKTRLLDLHGSLARKSG